MKKRVHIIITTYNRSEMLKRLLIQISNNNNPYDISISVYDDCSNDIHSSANRQICHHLMCEYVRFDVNHGKKRYFELINYIFANIPVADYYFMFPDDITIEPNIFTKSVNIFDSIQDILKVCMNLDVDGRLGKECWTAFTPIDMGDYYLSQWVDMCFIANRRLFTEVGRIRVGNRWEHNESLGSGVGAVISRNLNSKNYGMYHLKEPLTYHGNHISQMNPINETNSNKLRTS
jgi:hypothetical protein